MASVYRTALLPYSPAQVFDVVADVSLYPEFLPAVKAVDVITETELEVVARVTVSAKGFSEMFVTRNVLTRPDRIDLDLVEGPLRTLKGGWRFSAIGNEGCKVELELTYEPGNLLVRAFSLLVDRAADKMVDAFCERVFHQMTAC